MSQVVMNSVLEYVREGADGRGKVSWSRVHASLSDPPSYNGYERAEPPPRPPRDVLPAIDIFHPRSKLTSASSLSLSATLLTPFYTPATLPCRPHLCFPADPPFRPDLPLSTATPYSATVPPLLSPHPTPQTHPHRPRYTSLHCLQSLRN